MIDCFSHRIGNLLGLLEWAVGQQDPKLIPTQSRQCIALADLGLENCRHLAQQFIPCGMTTGIIDDLEPI